MVETNIITEPEKKKEEETVCWHCARGDHVKFCMHQVREAGFMVYKSRVIDPSRLFRGDLKHPGGAASLKKHAGSNIARHMEFHSVAARQIMRETCDVGAFVVCDEPKSMFSKIMRIFT